MSEHQRSTFTSVTLANDDEGGHESESIELILHFGSRPDFAVLGFKLSLGFDQARKYWHPSDACHDMQEILKEHYGQLQRRRFVVPVEIEVYGSVSQKKFAEYLSRASVLSIRTEEHGNGPAECLVLPMIHWGFIRELKVPLNGKPDNPAVEWGLEDGDADR